MSSIHIHEEILIDSSSQPGDHVKIADAWAGHYPSLKGKNGKLIQRGGAGWSVVFEGHDGELLFNHNKGMEQLALVTGLPAAANLLLSHHMEIPGGPDTKAEEV